MKEFENNAFFWQKLDSLYLSSDFVIVNKKGSFLPEYPDTPFPCNFGFLKTLSNDKDDSIYCFKGEASKEVNSIIVSADLLGKALRVTLCIGCTDKEIDNILHYMNQTDFQKTVVMSRSNMIPSWGVTED